MNVGREDKGLRESRRRSAGMHTSERYERAGAAIIAAALARFERCGIAATRLVDISHDVHMTRELIYYYFANKTALCEAAAHIYVSRIADTLVGVMPDIASAEEFVVAIRNIAYDEQGEYTPMFRVLNEMGATRRVVWDACALVEGFDVSRLAFLVFGVLGLLEVDPNVDPAQVARAFPVL